MKIAICDDEVAVSEVTKSLLQQWAFHRSISLSVHSYENGDALILAQKSECFDLIFLDVLMPLLNGIDTAKELRRQNQNVPIIFLTSSPEFAVESYSVGAYFYQLKPIWEGSFFRLMDAVLGRKLLFHLENGAVLESAGSLDDLAGQLIQYSNFFRPHRSFLVNMEYIQNISSRSIKMVNDAEIPIPHGKCSEIKNTYMEYAFNGEQAVL